MSVFEDVAQSFKNPDAICNRKLRLHETHIAPLTNYVEALRVKYPDWEFPYFDPADGGIDARLLFLLEKPGPKTSPPQGGSGFISRNNNDPTAEATFSFMKTAGIPREETVLWNTIPGWNGTIKIAPNELRYWLDRFDLKKLIHLLPNLEAIVLVGGKAQQTRSLFEPYGKIFTSYHPARRNKNNPKTKAQYDLIPTRWREAYDYVLGKGVKHAKNI